MTFDFCDKLLKMITFFTSKTATSNHKIFFIFGGLYLTNPILYITERSPVAIYIISCDIIAKYLIFSIYSNCKIYAICIFISIYVYKSNCNLIFTPIFLLFSNLKVNKTRVLIFFSYYCIIFQENFSRQERTMLKLLHNKYIF